MTTTWDEALAGATPRRDADVIKAQLPLEWLLEQHGFAFTLDGTGRLISRCKMPNHATDLDNTSFAVYASAGDSRVYCGCWVCDFNQGDIFDFLKAWYPEVKTFPQALSKASEFYDAFMAEHNGNPDLYTRKLVPVGKSPEERELDKQIFTRRCLEANASASGPDRQPGIDLLIREKIEDGIPGWERLTADWLVNRWKLGTTTADRYLVFIPHITVMPDGTKQVLGYKTRTPKSKPFAVAGSELHSLYGEWLDVVPDAPVVLVEGESDTWTVDAYLRSIGAQEAVLGLPSGASARPKDEWIERLKGREVTLMFDGDVAGRKATIKWASALQEAGIRFRVVQLDDDFDASMLTDQALGKALLDARTLFRDLNVIHVDEQGCFAKWIGQGENARLKPVCDWSFLPQRELQFPDGFRGYEGTLEPGGVQTVITAGDLSSNNAITAWSNRHGRSWMGVGTDAQYILNRLQSLGPLLPKGLAAPSIGWHFGSFVWPTGKIGDGYLVYHPLGPTLPEAGDMIHLQRGPWNPEVVQALLRMNKPEVTAPILAWLAAAPLRSLFERFPALAITGGAGSGKTTMIETMLKTFSNGFLGSTITSTTPHAVQVFCGITNGMPVWFDEYRHGAREEAKMMLDQVLRDAWASQSSFKGGVGENKSDVYAFKTTAPLVISGEDAFSERSHAERMILLKLRRNGRNPAALDELEKLGDQSGFGYAYLSWLVGLGADGRLPERFVSPHRDRIGTNLWVLDQGWALLQEFLRGYGYDLPAASWDYARAQAETLADNDPVIEALRWTLYENDPALYGVRPEFSGNGDVVVNVPAFVSTINRSRVFTLPGGINAVKDKLIEEWGANENDPTAAVRLPGAYNKLKNI